MATTVSTHEITATDPTAARIRTARRIFFAALIFNSALTVFWLFAVLAHRTGGFFQSYDIALGRVASGILFFYVIWGFIWYGIKTLLLRYFVGFSKQERRQAFSSRMREPFDVASFTARYSERRIRIVDMIGRRGRFITLAGAGFYYLYMRVLTDPSPDFARFFLQDNLADAVITIDYNYGEGPNGPYTPVFRNIATEIRGFRWMGSRKHPRSQPERSFDGDAAGCFCQSPKHPFPPTGCQIESRDY